MSFPRNYDKRPFVTSPGPPPIVGWDAIHEALSIHRVVVIDCYVGVRLDHLAKHLARPVMFGPDDWLRNPAAIDALVEPWLGNGDPIFGVLTTLGLQQFIDPRKLASAQRRIADATGPVLVYGPGASAVARGDHLVYADMPRREGQLRQHRDEVANLGVDNATLEASLQYKRSYFVDWRVCDRWKKPLLDAADAFLDTTTPTPKLAQGDAVRQGLALGATRPLRVVPLFDPGPWGGQWMREACGLEGYRSPEPDNYAWCFDCVPEENSLVLRMSDIDVELPSVDLLFQHPRQLLGDPVHARFGDEFPIRFDFLDTMGGGNLSFQVHPLTQYIQQHFGMHYTQDESYYILDAGDEGACYLGVIPDTDPATMRRALEAAQIDGEKFDAKRFANVLPVKQHDHILIPAGTVHCSGRDTMVLEISATPYIFTFKLYDWGRMGLDGKPRPINIDRGMANIDFTRDTAFCERELVNAVEPIAHGDGWREERTGLHRREFIETRRHWFTKPVHHDTGGMEVGGVHVLNLVQGEAAMVEPSLGAAGAFVPFEVHYAETWIVPAAVGRYTVRPLGGGEHATVRASVRTSAG